MASRRRRWIVLGIAAAGLAMLLLGLTSRGDTPDVTVTRVARQTIERWISTNGKVEPIQPHVLRARLDTFVLRVGVVEGQKVKRGQLLVQLDATAAESQLAEARHNLLLAQRDQQYAQAGGPPDQLAQLQSDLTKTLAKRDRLSAEQKTLETLVKEHAATRDELEQNQLQLKQAEADLLYLQQKKKDLATQARFNAGQARLRIDQAQARIRDLGEKVAASRLLAPVDGTVYALPVKVGDYVHVGDPVASVADLRLVRVRAYVDEVDLGSVALGQHVEVQWDGLPEQMWTGRTTEIPKQVVPYRDRRVGEVLCSVKSAEGRLLPNTNVDVRIELARRADALVVPRAAVQGDATGRYVYVVRNEKLQRRPVKVGIASTSQFEIVEGLKEGERVALPGAQPLKDGMEIHPVEVH